MENGTVISIRDLCKKFTRNGEEFFALQDVTLSISRGQTVVFTGRSGSGKTTLLNVVGGLEAPTAGEVSVCGCSLMGMGESELADFRRDRVGFVFQAFHLIEEESAVTNVMLPLHFAGTSPRKAAEKARTHLEHVGLAEIMNAPVRTFSAGQKQRTALARSLVNDPDVLIADEPTGNLDRENAEAVFSILSQYASGEGKTVLIATHDVDVLPGNMGIRYSIENGKILSDAETA